MGITNRSLRVSENDKIYRVKMFFCALSIVFVIRNTMFRKAFGSTSPSSCCPGMKMTHWINYIRFLVL